MKKILYISLLLLFSISCDRTEPHFQQDEELIIPEQDAGKDPNKGVVVGFNTDGVSSTAINDLHIFFFNQNEMLSRHSYHTQMEQVALEKMLMESGAYTLFTIFNTEEGLLDALTRSSALPPLSLSQLIDRVNGYYEDDTYPEMLTGMVQHSVGNSIEQVIVTVTDEPILDVVTEVSFELTYPSADIPAFTRSGSTHIRRAVVELFKSGTKTLVSRKEFATTDEMKFTLTNGTYDARIWSDYTYNIKEDLYYNTSKTDNIHILSKSPYIGNSDYKDAAAKAVTISTDTPNNPVELKRPFAKYQIVATDVEEYEAMKDRRGYPNIADLDIEIIYEMYFPDAYNMTTGELSGSDTGYQFDSRTSDPTATEVTLATDYVFVNGASSSVTVTIHIKDAEGETISKVMGNKFEYKAAHLPTISGNFLTAGKGGIDIDTSWGPDINVEF